MTIQSRTVLGEYPSLAFDVMYILSDEDIPEVQTRVIYLPQNIEIEVYEDGTTSPRLT